MDAAIALGGAVTMGEALKLSAWPKVDFDQWSPLEALAAIESLTLDEAEENACLGMAVACARLIRRLQAAQGQALARACGLAESSRTPAGAPYEVIDGVELVAAEAGLALTLSRGEASALVEDAVQVTTDLPRLAALAHEGRLDWALAAKTHHRMSRELLQQFGADNSKYLFLQLEPGDHPNYPFGRNDNTHFSELGARKMAQLVVNDLRAQHIALAEEHLAKPLPKNAVATPSSANSQPTTP